MKLPMRDQSAYRAPALPDAYLPFSIDEPAAAAAVAQALSTAWAVPATFRRTARLVELEAVWVPAWLLHARLTGGWVGERGEERATEGTFVSDSDCRWSGERGTFDDALTLTEEARRGVESPPRVSSDDAESLSALLVDAPGRDAVHLDATVSSDDAVGALGARAASIAKHLAAERCGGDRQRAIETSERVELVSVRRIWLAHYRGKYRWDDETHGLWVAATSPGGRVSLDGKPSDAAEIAAREAADAAKKKANSRLMNLVALFAIAPLAFILLYHLIASGVGWLIR